VEETSPASADGDGDGELSDSRGRGWGSDPRRGIPRWPLPSLVAGFMLQMVLSGFKLHYKPTLLNLFGFSIYVYIAWKTEREFHASLPFLDVFLTKEELLVSSPYACFGVEVECQMIDGV